MGGNRKPGWEHEFIALLDDPVTPERKVIIPGYALDGRRAPQKSLLWANGDVNFLDDTITILGQKTDVADGAAA